MTEFHQFENIPRHDTKPTTLLQNGQKLSDGLDCYSRVQTRWQVFGTCVTEKIFMWCKFKLLTIKKFSILVPSAFSALATHAIFYGKYSISCWIVLLCS